MPPKNIPLLIVLTCLAIGPSLATGGNARVAKNRDLVGRIRDEAASRGWSDSTMIEGYDSLPRKIPDYASLQKGMREDWEVILDEIETVAPARTEKVIVLMALQDLPRPEYLQSVRKLEDLVEMGRMDKYLFKMELFPFTKHLRGVFVEERSADAVTRIFLRAKGIFRDDPNLIDFCNRVLTGKIDEEEEVDATGGATMLPDPAATQDARGLQGLRSGLEVLAVGIMLMLGLWFYRRWRAGAE